VAIGLTDAGRGLREQVKGVPFFIGSCIADTAEEYARLRRLLGEAVARVEGT
jgi:hypothetical protein